MEKQPSRSSHVQDLEKPTTAHDDILNSFTPEQKKKLIRRVDMRLVLNLGFLYCISLLDRTNLGAASVAGMQTDLGMNTSNNGYSLTSLVFFITYTIFQIPATAIIRKLGPQLFLSSIVFLWGVVVVAFGLVPTWQPMAGLRAILGAFEAGFYPGCVYLLSTWYPRYELQKRNAAFYLIGSMASGFGGILAYGLMQMDGLGGKEGWRWVFILEGIFTCVLGIAAFPMLVDFPEKSPKSWHFLNEHEAAYIVASINHDRGDVYAEDFTLRKYLANCADSKVWLYALLYLLTTANTYSIAYFLPIILQHSMGFSVAKAQCLVAPPYVAAAVVMFVQGMLADKWRIRGPIIAVNAAMGLLGLGLLGYMRNPAPRYFGAFLATIAGDNNIRGQWKRALTSATLIGGGSIGGLIGTTVFHAQDAPNYWPGLLTTMAANAGIIALVGLLIWKCDRANTRVEARGRPIEGLVGFKNTF